MKEIKIMDRADFAGDVALWIFLIIYIPFCIYIFIFIIITISGPLFDYLLVVFPRVGLRSGASGRPWRLGGFPLRILPSLGAREPPSLLLYLVVAHSRFLLFLIVVLARLAAPLSRRRRTTQPSPQIFHGLSRFIRFRFMTASSSCVAARGRRVYTSRRLLFFSFVVVKARKSHAGAFAPPAPLRVTGICKSIYL